MTHAQESLSSKCAGKGYRMCNRDARRLGGIMVARTVMPDRSATAALREKSGSLVRFAALVTRPPSATENNVSLVHGGMNRAPIEDLSATVRNLKEGRSIYSKEQGLTLVSIRQQAH